MNNMNPFMKYLTDESKTLIQFYDGIIKKNKPLFDKIDKIINHEKNEKNESTTYNEFQKYIYELLQSNISLNNDDKLHATTYKNHDNTYIKVLNYAYENHFKHNRYIDPDIKEYISLSKNPVQHAKCNLIVYKLDLFESSDKQLVINFFIYEDITPSLTTYLNEKVMNILLLVKVLQTITSHNCSHNELSLYIFMTPFKRTINNCLKEEKEVKGEKEVLSAKNVNGGFCYGCTERGEVFIMRKQEWFKVLCHELIHNYGVDTYIWDFMKRSSSARTSESRIYKKFINNFNLSKNINQKNANIGLQECLVEFWGEFFNNSLFAFKISKTFAQYITAFDKLHTYEIVQSSLQVCKILNYNAMTFKSLLSKNTRKTKNIRHTKRPQNQTQKHIVPKNINNTKQKTSLFNNYQERTHIFSYYILKLFLIFDYKQFINSNISLTKQANDFILNFEPSLQNMQLFMNYMVNKGNKGNNTLYKLMQVANHEIILACKKLAKIKQTQDSPDDKIAMFSINLRMSCCEW
jgi:hypothetical protein